VLANTRSAACKHIRTHHVSRPGRMP